MTIENFALIDRLRLAFGAGLNVLSGETGAGKSIILDALQAALGGRTSADVIRTGAERAVIEAVFDLGHQPGRVQALAEMGVDVGEDNLLVVHREVQRAGRARITLNGRSATAAMLRDACDGLCDLHGQHEHQSLLQPEKHLDLLDQYGGSLLTRAGKPLEVLDQFAGDELLGLRRTVGRLHQGLSAIAGELAGLLGDDRDRARRLDLLRFQLEELDAARLRDGEEEELEAELRLLAHAEKLRRAAEEGYTLLHEGTPRQAPAVDLIGKVSSDLADATRHDPSLQQVVELLETAGAHLREATHFLADYRERVEVDPARMADVEERLRQISGLKRKYGDTVAEMLAYRDEVQRELHRLQSSQDLVAELKERQALLGREAIATAERLTAARQAAAAELSARVSAELADLGFAQGQFSAGLHRPTAGHWSEVGPRGWDRVEFLFSPNVGEPPKPLIKIVSGGEMSRIMLALKTILARVDNVQTLVFDEIDSGISGRAAQAVAEKLATIARDRQVLCVTHLAQVAAMADNHFRIDKEVTVGRTATRVDELDAEGRTLEIARMMGGVELTRLTMEHARELLETATGHKHSLRSA